MAITSADILDYSRCTSRCKHCAKSSVIGRSAMSTEEMIQIIEDLKEAGIEMISLSGGEPTARKDLDRVLEAAKAQEFKMVHLVTNGQWGGKAEEMLVHYMDMGVGHVAVSLDGFEQTHDDIRANPGLHAKVMNIINSAVELRKKKVKIPHLRVNITAQPDNANQIYTLAKYLIEDLLEGTMTGKGVSVHCFYTSRYGAGAALEMTPEQIEQVRMTQQLTSETGLNIKPNDRPYKYSFEDFMANPDTKCDHFKAVNVSSDGSVFLCPQHFPPYIVPVGNFRETPLVEIIRDYKDSEFHRIFVDNLAEKKKFLAEVDSSRYEGMKWTNFCIPCTILNSYISFRMHGKSVEEANDLTERVTKGIAVPF